jgi:hypothetical protein
MHTRKLDFSLVGVPRWGYVRADHVWCARVSALSVSPGEGEPCVVCTCFQPILIRTGQGCHVRSGRGFARIRQPSRSSRSACLQVRLVAHRCGLGPHRTGLGLPPAVVAGVGFASAGAWGQSRHLNALRLCASWNESRVYLGMPSNGSQGHPQNSPRHDVSQHYFSQY